MDKAGKIKCLNETAKDILGLNNKSNEFEIVDLINQDDLQQVCNADGEIIYKSCKNNGSQLTFAWIPIKDSETIRLIGIFWRNELLKQIKNNSDLTKELNAIIESSYDGIYVTDEKGVTVRVNKAFERITGLSREECLGKNVLDLVEEGVFAQSGTHKVLSEKKPVTIIQTIKSNKQILITCSPVFDENGKLFRVVTNARDITELNNLRKELKKSKELATFYKHELNRLRIESINSKSIVAKSSKMKKVLEIVKRVAPLDLSVLILGESGVGKELIASAIHEYSHRKEGRFIKINCGAIPDNLLESELFGYTGGAFTGANSKGKPGLFEVADKGTIFLDEIAELPLKLQAKLLRVLQEKEIMRIGATKPKTVDTRIIAATNRDLEEMVSKGLFREDLFYRLNVVPIKVPPLRERKEDILELVLLFMEEFNKKYKKNKKFTVQAINTLTDYKWPGNVRELRNLIERLVVMVDQDEISVEHLPEYISSKKHIDNRISIKINEVLPLKEAVELVEKKLIEKALSKHGSIRKAAKELGMNHSSIARKFRRLCKNAEKSKQ